MILSGMYKPLRTLVYIWILHDDELDTIHDNKQSGIITFIMKILIIF